MSAAWKAHLLAGWGEVPAPSGGGGPGTVVTALPARKAKVIRPRPIHDEQAFGPMVVHRLRPTARRRDEEAVLLA